MKEIIINKDNIKDENINTVIRCKCLFINKDKIMLGNESGILQFIGGHLENNEGIRECLKREIQEETGIEIELKDIPNPYLKLVTYNRDWPESDINTKCIFYYFVINSNKEINLNNTNYTRLEKKNKYKLEYYDLNTVIETLNNNIDKHEANKYIVPEMVIALNTYFENK